MKFAAVALLALLGLAFVLGADARAYEIDHHVTNLQAIPPGSNCNKSCYNKAGLLATKKILFKLCGVSGVKILTTTPPNIADMATFCKTYIYHRFPSPDALVKYQNCEASQALYNKNMYPVKAPSNFWGTDGKPPKFSTC